VDDLAAARAAERPRIDNAAISCARPVRFRNAVSCCEGRDAHTTTR